MELPEVVRKRRMRRTFAAEQLPRGMLQGFLDDAADTSLCAAGALEWLLLTEPGERQRFFEATCEPEFLAHPGSMRSLLDAPAIVVPLSRPDSTTAGEWTTIQPSVS